MSLPPAGLDFVADFLAAAGDGAENRSSSPSSSPPSKRLCEREDGCFDFAFF